MLPANQSTDGSKGQLVNLKGTAIPLCPDQAFRTCQQERAMFADDLPVRVDIEQRVVAGRPSALSVAFAHPHDDIDPGTLRNPAEPVSAFAGNAYCICQQLPVQFVQQRLFARRNVPDPHRIARDEGCGEDDQASAGLACIHDQFARFLQGSTAVEKDRRYLGYGDHEWRKVCI